MTTEWTLRGITFNGRDSQLIVPHNPLAGATAFSIEAQFVCEAGGEPEQRFVHVQEEGVGRALLELRATAAGWYADTFVNFASGQRFLNAPSLLHPFGEWHTLALVYTGTVLRQYVDGAFELEADAPTGVLGTGSVSLGMRLNGISPFKGQIATVRFTPKALAPAQLLKPAN